MTLLLTAAFLFLSSPVYAGTCALCREALASGGNPGLIKGFYWSILLIASVPLIIMGFAGRLIWRAWRTQRSHTQPSQKLP